VICLQAGTDLAALVIDSPPALLSDAELGSARQCLSAAGMLDA